MVSPVLGWCARVVVAGYPTDHLEDGSETTTFPGNVFVKGQILQQGISTELFGGWASDFERGEDSKRDARGTSWFCESATERKKRE